MSLENSLVFTVCGRRSCFLLFVCKVRAEFKEKKDVMYASVWSSLQKDLARAELKLKLREQLCLGEFKMIIEDFGAVSVRRSVLCVTKIYLVVAPEPVSLLLDCVSFHLDYTEYSLFHFFTYLI